MGESVHAVFHGREGVPEAFSDEPDRHDGVFEADWLGGSEEDVLDQPVVECV